jgi:hypothetical protein
MIQSPAWTNIFSLFHIFQTVSGAHPAFYTFGIGVSSGRKKGWTINLATYSTSCSDLE